MNVTGNIQDIRAETVPLTLAALIESYKSDPVSGWRKLRYHTRVNHETLLRRMVADRGDVALATVRRRDLEEWYVSWSEDGQKPAMGHAFMSKLRTLCNYGASMLEDDGCDRVSRDLGRRKFEMRTKAQEEFLTASQATAIRTKAHEFGYHSIALAQAMQFDLCLRQKDVIGEWVPESEPGPSEVHYHGKKWLRGLLWSEIDGDMVLRHVTSKKQKALMVDLKLAPMVYEEIQLLPDWLKDRDRPLVLCESTGLPWQVSEFRRKWRMIADACGVPAAVKNCHSRSGGISEGTDAGLSLEQMRHAATHSNVSMTAHYSRNTAGKIAETLKARAAYRAAAAETE